MQDDDIDYIYKDIFEHLGLPFFNDSVQDLDSIDLEKIRNINRDRYKDKSVSIGSKTFEHNEAVEAFSGLFSFTDVAEYETSGAIYYGNFKLIEFPEMAVKALEIRNELIKKLIRELGNYKSFSLSDETQQAYIRENAKLITIRLKNKLFITYEEYEALFSDREILKYKKEIKEYEKENKRLYEEIKKLKAMGDENVCDYKPVCNIFIEANEYKINEIEKFFSENKKSPQGYINYVKKNNSIETYRFFLNQLQAKIPERARKKHSYIVAESGSGKSELIKTLIYSEIQNLKKQNCSIILIDPHGDIAEQIANFKEFNTLEGKDRLVYIDPLAKDGYSPSINPFELEEINEKTVGLMTQELKRILSVLLSGAGTTAQMDAILSPCISTLLYKKGSDFKELQRFFDDNNNDDLIELGSKNPNPEHRSLFLSKFKDDSYRATKHGIYTRIQILLNDPVFKRLISNKTTINLKKLTEEKKIIIFKLPLGEVGSESVEAFGRFIVGIMRVIALQRSSIPESQRTPIHLYVDEFQNFVSGDIEKVLTQLRKYGLYLTLAHQFVGQGDIDTSLQKAMFSSGVIVAGSNDAKTLKTISTELDVDIDDLRSLNVGSFFLKSGKNPAFKIVSPTYLLGYNHAMTREEFKGVLNVNIEKYYAKLSKQTETDALKQEIRENEEITGVLNSDKNTNKKDTKSLKPKYRL